MSTQLQEIVAEVGDDTVTLAWAAFQALADHSAGLQADFLRVLAEHVMTPPDDVSAALVSIVARLDDVDPRYIVEFAKAMRESPQDDRARYLLGMGLAIEVGMAAKLGRGVSADFRAELGDDILIRQMIEKWM